MAIQKINLGTEPHGVGGDSYRTANDKINKNFEEVSTNITNVDEKYSNTEVKITEEVARAKQVEDELKSNLEKEASRAVSAEANILGVVESESKARTAENIRINEAQAQLKGFVDSEVEKLKLEDASIKTDLDKTHRYAVMSQTLGLGSKFYDKDGQPLSGGKVYTYEAGTSTPSDTYKDSEFSIPNTNPIILDETGSVDLFLKGTYRFRIFDKNDTLVEEQDNVSQVFDSASAKMLSDKLDALPFEGGVLADTFVTVTANGADRVPRNQRDVNAERTSIKDFGNYGDGGDWTPALRKIVGKDLKVWLPRGTYIFKTDAIDCLGQDIHFEGDDATVVLEKGTSNHVFNIDGCNRVIFEGINFESPTSLKVLLKWSPTSLIGLIRFRWCDFSGYVSLFRNTGSLTQNPITQPYGVLVFDYKNNDASNVKSSFVQLTNTPTYFANIHDNTVHNLEFSFFYFGISNESANENLLKQVSKFSLKRNTVTTDDDFWMTSSISQYYCFALVEGREVEWHDNNINGMKIKSATASLYDAYLSCMIVHSKGNTYKNIAVFHPDNPHTTLIKAKQDSIPELKASKIFEHNTYTIDESWITRIGETTCKHKLFGVGVANAGDVLFKNLTIDISGLNSDDPYVCQNIEIINVNVNCNYVTGIICPIRPLPFNDKANLTIKGLTVNVKNPTQNVVLYSQNSSNKTYWANIDISDVDLLLGGEIYTASLFSYLRAKRGSLKRNSINGVLSKYNLLLCNFKELSYSDNSYRSAIDVEIQPFYQCEFSGEVDLTESLSGIFKDINIFPALASYDKDIRFKYDLRFEDAAGTTEVSFTYDIKVDGEVKTIEVLDGTDVLHTLILGSGSSDIPRNTIKTVGASTSSSSIKVNFYNTARPYLVVMPTPAGNRGKLTMRVKSFYL